MPRDDFPTRVVSLLVKRAASRCSICDCTTSGPGQDPDGSVNVGVAAHIRAASPGGPRYDATMSPAERRSIKNGIWLCQNDAKHVDDDPARFTVAYLEELKATHEARIGMELRTHSRTAPVIDDEAILSALEAVLDRPAMYEPFAGCRNSNFGKAIDDVIEALNTGVHRLRDGTEVQRIPSRHLLKSKRTRDTLAEIVDRLGDLRAQHALLVASKKINDGCGCATPTHAAAPLDDLREEIVTLFRSVRPSFAVTVRRSLDDRPWTRS